jgi:D-xylose transport system ATP-binding protein
MSNGPSTAYALEMRNIKKSFGTVVALSGVDLQVAQGTIHGLIGQNGAGKSTLMKVLSGYYPNGAYDGEIIVGGNEVILNSPSDAQKNGIAIVPQEITVAETLTVAENILLSVFAREPLKRYARKSAADEIDIFLKKNGIPLDSRQLVSGLTLPQKQILMIANALYMSPKVLVLDEPTSSLTSDEIATLFEIVRNLKKLNFTTVFITHKISEILELCDLVSIIRDGNIVYEGMRKDFDTSTLIDNMIGRKLGELYPEKVELSQNSQPLLSVSKLIVENPRKQGEKMLDAFSFDLYPGEVLGLGGLVGSGRTEVLKAIYGENQILSGEIRVTGGIPYSRNIPSAINAGIYYITEDRKVEGLFFNQSIRGNLTASILKIIGRLGVLKKSSEKEIASGISVSLRVKPSDIETMIGNLSGGNQQKVLLGKSLLARPQIFMLDEPTKGVDISSKAEIYRIIRDLSAKGAGVILVSSEFPELLALSHRVLVFSNGKYQGVINGDLEMEHDLMLMSIGGN